MKYFLFFFLCIFFSCNKNVLPKPKAYLALEFPFPKYVLTNEYCRFSFEINKISKINNKENRCLKIINYPKMRAKVYLSHLEVKSNLDSLLNDAYKMPMKHISQAIDIHEKVYSNPIENKYGTLFRIVGNSASQLQFFLTDSTSNFLVGSLYFYTRPNYDSLMPAATYIEKDLIHLMETLKWKN